ncbi:MAG: substrate-binding domain-containing protein [Clostridia bacterium]
MKKFVSIFLATMMVFAMVACAPEEKEPAAEAAAAQETEIAVGEPQKQIRLAWVNPSIGHPLYNMQDEGAKLAAADYGVTVDILGTSSAAPEEYVAQIEIAITEKYDGIILCPFSPAAMVPAIQKAKDAGIPVVNTICDTGDNPELRMCLLGLSLKDFGASEADAIAEKTGGKGVVCFTQTRFDNPIQNEIQEGFKAQLEKYPELSLPVIDEITIDTMVATEKFQNILTGYPELSAIVVNDATGASVAAKMVKEMGRKIDILSIDDVPETLDMIDKGEIWGTIAQNYIGMGYESVRILVDHLNGETVPDFVSVPLKLVTKENLKTYKDELLSLTHTKGTTW